jgi:hypothetical protein
LAWDSFSQPCFVHDDGFGPISLVIHSAKLGQPMYGFDLGKNVGLLGACIRSNSGSINEYEFGPLGVQSWLGLINMLGSFSYMDQQNIFLKLKGKFVHYCPYYLGEYLTIKEEVF